MRRIYTCIAVLLLVMLSAGLAGCGEKDALDGTQWSLYSINGNEIIEGSHISIYFRDGSCWGCDGCNRYGRSYAVEGPNTIIFSGGDVTEVYCSSPEGVMEQAEAYHQAFFTETMYYRITDGHLELGDSENLGILVFDPKPEYDMDPADLIGTSWSLVSLDGDEVLEGLSVTLYFDSAVLASGRAGCFYYELYYQASGDDINWGNMSVREGELAPELEKQALAYTSIIASGANYRLTDDRLEIFTARGETLVYEPLSE